MEHSRGRTRGGASVAVAPAIVATAVVLSAIALGALLFWGVWPMLFRGIADEGSVPDGPSTSALPSGMVELENRASLSNGGGWRHITYQWPGHTTEDIYGHFGIGSEAADLTRCSPVSFFDPRSRCFEARSDPDGDVARVLIYWERGF